jgi:hypothetical protein
VSSSRSKTDYYTSERSTHSRRSAAPADSSIDREARQCYGPGCVEAARVGSKYCSDECGLKLAHKYYHLANLSALLAVEGGFLYYSHAMLTLVPVTDRSFIRTLASSEIASAYASPCTPDHRVNFLCTFIRLVLRVLIFCVPLFMLAVC